MSQPLAPGQPAPAFNLKAIGSGRIFRPADYRDRPVLLIFADHNTGRSAQAVVERVRRRFPRFEQLAIALVIDARIVPRLLRGMAEGQMEKEYRQAAAAIPSGYDPADHLILLPDWNGEITRAYGAADLGRHIHLFLIGLDGVVKGEYHGPDPAARALEMAQALLGN
jgi:peroxiredoxin